MSRPPAPASRALTLASPRPKGPDVAALQRALNARYDHFGINHRVAVDGDFGRQTLKAVRQIAWLMGVRGDAREKLGRGRVSISTQRLVRKGREKTRLERLAATRRRRYRKKLRRHYAASGGERAVKVARTQLGVTEDPAGSNWGPQVSKYIRQCGYTFPVYWCGAFVSWCLSEAGAKVPTWIRLGYTGYITADARAGANNLRAISWENARPGDIVVYAFDHIGMIESVSGDTLTAIEGNTSSGSSGSQSNGGGVFRRQRSRSDVVTIARPGY